MPIFERWQRLSAANSRRNWKFRMTRSLSPILSVTILLLGIIGDAAAFTEEELEDPDSDRVAELLGSDDPLHPIFKSVVRRSASFEIDVYDDPDEPIVEFDDTGSPIIPVGQCYDSGGINFKRIPASASSESSEGNGDPQPGDVPPTSGKSGTGSGLPDKTTVRPTTAHAESSEGNGDPRLGDVPPISSTSRKGAGLADRTTSRPPPVNSISSSASGTDSGGLPGSTTFLPTAVISISSSSSGTGPGLPDSTTFRPTAVNSISSSKSGTDSGLPESTTFLPTPVHSASSDLFSAKTDTAKPLISSTSAAIIPAFVDIFDSYLPPPTEKPSPSTSSSATSTATAGYRRERNQQASPGPEKIPGAISFNASDVTGIRLDGDRLSVSEKPELESEDFQHVSSPNEASSTQRAPTARGLTFALGFLTRAPQTPASIPPPPKRHQENRPPPSTSQQPGGSSDYYDDYEDYDNNNSIAIAHEEFEIHGHEGVHVIDDDDETASNFSAFGTRCEHFDIPALELLVPGKRNYTVIPWIATTPPSVLKSKLSDASPGAKSLSTLGNGIEEFLRNELSGSPEAPISGKAAEHASGNTSEVTEDCISPLPMPNVTNHSGSTRTVAPTHSTFTKHTSSAITTFASKSAFTPLAQTKVVPEQIGTSTAILATSSEGHGGTEIPGMGISVTTPSHSLSKMTDSETTVTTASVPLATSQTASSAQPKDATTPRLSASKASPSSSTVPDVASTSNRLPVSPSTASQHSASTKLVSITTSEATEDIYPNDATTSWPSAWSPSSSATSKSNVASTVKRRILNPSTTSPNSISTTSLQRSVSSFGHSVPHGGGSQTPSSTPFGITAATPLTEDGQARSNAVLVNAIDLGGDVPAVALHRSQNPSIASIAELLLDNTGLQVANESLESEADNSAEKPTSTDFPNSAGNTPEAVIPKVTTTASNVLFTHEQTSAPSKLTTVSSITLSRPTAQQNKSTKPVEITENFPQATHLPPQAKSRFSALSSLFNETEASDIGSDVHRAPAASLISIAASLFNISDTQATNGSFAENPEGSTPPTSVGQPQHRMNHTRVSTRRFSRVSANASATAEITTIFDTATAVTARATGLSPRLQSQISANPMQLNESKAASDDIGRSIHQSPESHIASVASSFLTNSELQVLNETLESVIPETTGQPDLMEFQSRAGHTPGGVATTIDAGNSQLPSTHKQTNSPSNLTSISARTVSLFPNQPVKPSKSVSTTASTPQATVLPSHSHTLLPVNFRLFNESEATSDDVGSNIHQSPAFASIASSFLDNSGLQVANESLESVIPETTWQPDLLELPNRTALTTGPVATTINTSNPRMPSTHKQTNSPSSLTSISARTVSQFPSQTVRPSKPVSSTASTPQASELPPHSLTQLPVSSWLFNESAAADIVSNVHRSPEASINSIAASLLDVSELQGSNGSLEISSLGPLEQQVNGTPAEIRNSSPSPASPTAPTVSSIAVIEAAVETTLTTVSRHLRLEGSTFPSSFDSFRTTHAVANITPHSFGLTANPTNALHAENKKINCTNVTLLVAVISRPKLIHLLPTSTAPSLHSTLTSQATNSDTLTSQPHTTRKATSNFTQNSKFAQFLATEEPFALQVIEPQAELHLSPPVQLSQALAIVPYAETLTLETNITATAVRSNQPGYPVITAQINTTGLEHQRTTPKGQTGITFRLGSETPLQKQNSGFNAATTSQPEIKSTSTASKQQGKPTGWTEVFGERTASFTTASPSAPTTGSASANVTSGHISTLSNAGNSKPATVGPYGQQPITGPAVGWDLTTAKEPTVVPLSAAHFTSASTGFANGSITSRGFISNHTISTHVMPAQAFTRGLSHLPTPTVPPNGLEGPAGTATAPFVPNVTLAAEKNTTAYTDEDSPSTVKYRLPSDNGVFLAIPLVVAVSSAEIDSESPQSVKSKPGQPAFAIATVSPNPNQPGNNTAAPPANSLSAIPPAPGVPYPFAGYGQPPAIPSGYGLPSPYGQPPSGGYGGGYGGYGGIGAPNPNYFNEYRPPNAYPGKSPVVLGAVAPAVGPISGYEQEPAFVDLTPKPNYGIGGRPILPVTEGYGPSPRTNGYGLEVDVEAFKYQSSRPVFASASENPNPYGPGPSSANPFYASPPSAQPPTTLPYGNGYPTQPHLLEHPGTALGVSTASPKYATGNSNPYEPASTSASSGPGAKLPTPQPPGGDGYPVPVPTAKPNNTPEASKTVSPQGGIPSTSTSQPAAKTSPPGKSGNASTEQPPTSHTTADINRKTTTIGDTAGYPGAVTAVTSPTQKPSPTAFTFHFGGEPSPATTTGSVSNHSGTASSVGPSGPPSTKLASVAEPAITTPSGNTISHSSNVSITTSARQNSTPFEFTFRLDAIPTTTSPPAKSSGHSEPTSAVGQTGPPSTKSSSTAQTTSTAASGVTAAYPGVVPVVSSTPSKPSSFEFSFRFGGETTTSSTPSETSKYPGSASSVISKSYSPSPPVEAYFHVPEQSTASTTTQTKLPVVPSRPSAVPPLTTPPGNPYLPPASATGKQFETITSTTNSRASVSGSSSPISLQATSTGHASTPPKLQPTESSTTPSAHLAPTTITPLASTTSSATPATEDNAHSPTPPFWAVRPSPTSPRATLADHASTSPQLQPTVSSTSTFAQFAPTTVTPSATAVSSTTPAALSVTVVTTFPPTTQEVPSVTQAEFGPSLTQPFWAVRYSPSSPQETSAYASTSPQLQSTEPSAAPNARLLPTATTSSARVLSIIATAALPNITSAPTTQEASGTTQGELGASPTEPFWAVRHSPAPPLETSVGHPSTTPQLKPTGPTSSPFAPQLAQTSITHLSIASATTTEVSVPNTLVTAFAPTTQEVSVFSLGGSATSPTQPFWAVRQSQSLPHSISVVHASTSPQLQPTETSPSPNAHLVETTTTPLAIVPLASATAALPNITSAPTTQEVSVTTQGEHGASTTQPLWAVTHSPSLPRETSVGHPSTSPQSQPTESSPAPFPQPSPTTSTLIATGSTSNTPAHLSSTAANTPAPATNEVPVVTKGEYGTSPTQPFWANKPSPESPLETSVSQPSTTPTQLQLTVSSAAPFAQFPPTVSSTLAFVPPISATSESPPSTVNTTSALATQVNTHPADETVSGTSPRPTGYNSNAPNTPSTSSPSIGYSNPYDPRVTVATQGGYGPSPTQPFWAIRPPSPSQPIDILLQSYPGGALTTGQPPPWVISTGSSLLTEGPQRPPTGSQYSALGPTTQPNPYGGSLWPSSFAPPREPQTPAASTTEPAATSKSTTATGETVTKTSAKVTGTAVTDSLRSNTATPTGQPPTTASVGVAESKTTVSSASTLAISVSPTPTSEKLSPPSKLQLVDTAAPTPNNSATTAATPFTSKPVSPKLDGSSSAETSKGPTTAKPQSNITTTSFTSPGSSTKLSNVAATIPTAGSNVTPLQQASSTPVRGTITKPTQASPTYSSTTARPISAERLPPSNIGEQAYGPVAPPHSEAVAITTIIGTTSTIISPGSLATAARPRTDVPPTEASPPDDTRGSTEIPNVSLPHAIETITGGWIVLTPRSKTTKEPIGTTLYFGSLSTTTAAAIISQPVPKTTKSSSKSTETVATASHKTSPPQLSTAPLPLQGLTTLDARSRTVPSSFSPPLSSLRQRTSLSTSGNVQTTESLPPENLRNPYGNDNLPASTPVIDLIGQHPPALTQLVSATTSLPNPATTSSNLVSNSAAKSNIGDLGKGQSPPEVTPAPFDHTEQLTSSLDRVRSTSTSTATTVRVTLTQAVTPPSNSGTAGGPPGQGITQPQPDQTPARPIIWQPLTTQSLVQQPQQPPAVPSSNQNIPAWPSAPPPTFGQPTQVTLATITAWQPPFAPPAVETVRPSPSVTYTLLPLPPAASPSIPNQLPTLPPQNNLYGPSGNVGVFPPNPAPTLQPYIPPRQPELPSAFPSPPPAFPAGPSLPAVPSYSGYGPAPSPSGFGLPAPFALPPPPSPVVVDSYGGSGSSYPSGGYAQSSNSGSGYGGGSPGYGSAGSAGYGESRSGYGPQAGRLIPRPFNDGGNRGVPIAPYANWPATPRASVFYGSLAPNSYQNAAPPRLPGGQPDHSSWWQWGKARYGRRKKRHLTLSKLIM